MTVSYEDMQDPIRASIGLARDDASAQMTLGELGRLLLALHEERERAIAACFRDAPWANRDHAIERCLERTR